MNNPSEIAREALRQLAMQKVPPTPDNYRVHYFKIAGQRDPGAGSEFDPVRQLGELVAALPRTADERLLRQCGLALEKKQWPLLIALLAKSLGQTATPSNLPWPSLIARLLERWDTRLAGVTTAQKKAALERVLSNAPGNDTLYEKLNALVAQWSEKPSQEQTPSVTGDAPPLVPKTDAGQVADLCATLLDTAIASAVGEAPGLADEARALAGKARQMTAANAGELLSGLRRLAMRIEYHVEDQAELKAGLLHLLQLVVDNIGELVIDDRWLAGQMAVLREIIAGPMNPRTVDNAERRLKEVLFKQSQLKLGLVEAQSTIKSLLAGFVDQLASFAQDTGNYHDTLDGCSRKIGEASSITQLETVIGEVMSATRTIQDRTRSLRHELQENRDRATAAERRIAELERELSATSEMVRLDQLTGALNRRGLEEVFGKEIARAQRHGSPLCVGVLDIDNFKKLNDSLGHDAGDAALVHLVATVRETVRPQDTVARYGGEEFVVLLPDTELEEARQVLVRVQRELTRKFFLHQNQKILITFSAGVTQLPPDETREQAIKRADELMYQAKNTGKNKVVAA